MKFVIRHEIRGRVRVHFYQKDMSIRQADLLHYYLCTLPGADGRAGAEEQRKGPEPRIQGEAGPESGGQGICQILSAGFCQSRLYGRPLRQVPAKGSPLSAQGQAGGGGFGCRSDCRVCPETGFRHGGFCYVPSGDWGTSGRMDPQKVSGRPCQEHVLKHFRGMAECGWDRGPGSCFKNEGGRPGNGPYGKCDSSGRSGRFRGRHGEPGFHDRGISACQEGGGLLRVCGNSRRGGRDYPAGEDGCGRHQV